jgi:hypothetical protein
MIDKIFLFFALLFSLNMLAQKQQVSPYSFFGIGNSFASKTVEEALMGSVGASLSDPLRLNFSNPAGLSSLRFTTYAIGTLNSSAALTDETTTQNASVFSLSYVALGFPVGKRIGVSGGLRTRTGVGYTLKEGDVSTEQGLYTYEGEGGTNSLFLGVGYRLFKGFSVGIEGAYVFGTIDNTITQQQEDLQYDIRLRTENVLRGFDTKLGFNFQKIFSKKHTLGVGLVFQKKKDISVSATSQLYNGFFSELSESIVKTLEEEHASGIVKTPVSTTFSFGYGALEKWNASLEYSFQEALRFSGGALQNNLRKVNYNSSKRISLGGYYIPKYNSLTSYFSRVTYMAGIKYEDLGMQIEGTQIKDFGISFGVGLPMGRGLSNFNIGIEVGEKGEATSSLVEEKYVNLKMSFSLGDRWFKKRKID